MTMDKEERKKTMPDGVYTEILYWNLLNRFRITNCGDIGKTKKRKGERNVKE